MSNSKTINDGDDGDGDGDNNNGTDKEPSKTSSMKSSITAICITCSILVSLFCSIIRRRIVTFDYGSQTDLNAYQTIVSPLYLSGVVAVLSNFIYNYGYDLIFHEYFNQQYNFLPSSSSSSSSFIRSIWESLNDNFDSWYLCLLSTFHCLNLTKHSKDYQKILPSINQFFKGSIKFPDFASTWSLNNVKAQLDLIAKTGGGYFQFLKYCAKYILAFISMKMIRVFNFEKINWSDYFLVGDDDDDFKTWSGDEMVTLINATDYEVNGKNIKEKQQQNLLKAIILELFVGNLVELVMVDGFCDRFFARNSGVDLEYRVYDVFELCNLKLLAAWFIIELLGQFTIYIGHKFHISVR